MIKDIIIQAGGKGTRLEHLTYNKPKCIVSVDNLPIIFHAFKKFPKANFRIISDYKSDVLEKYLSVYAKDYNYKIIKTNKSGTISGIKDALMTINKDTPFMIMWSDIILAEKFQFPCDKKNYIGISKDFECRWSYINDEFIKIPSKENGVAGLFIFENKDFISDIPEEGALVKYLSTKKINFERINLYDAKEIGTLLAYDEGSNNIPKCRPFNQMEFQGDIVIKKPITAQGEEIAKDEIAWYKKIKELGYKNIPEIYSFEPLKMKVVDGKNIFEYPNLSKKQKKIILEQLIFSIKELHNLKEKTDVSEECVLKNYLTKTFDRIYTVRDLIPFAYDEYIRINGTLYKNPFFMKNEIQEKVFKYMPKYFSIIHGDCTFSNLMYDTFNEKAVLIDPRGYFGDTKIYGDENYDWAKLYYSLAGNYDQFNRKNFILEINEDNVELEIKSNGWDSLEKEFFDLIGNEKKDAIKFIHAIIWLSLTTYAWDDYDSICGAFYNGVVHLNNAIEKTVLELSSLSHTWLIDLDGTILKHNGHKNGGDELIKGCDELFASIEDNDKVVILTSREEIYKEETESFLRKNNVKFDEIIYNLPYGERILINDRKPSSLKTAYAINKNRDDAVDIEIKINEDL